VRNPFLAIVRGVIAGTCLVMTLSPGSVLGCAACFGRSDSTLAKGMNFGILSLLGVITCVLLGVAGFFVFLARQSARAAEANRTPTLALDSEAISRS
jgi:hypothetical protein